MPESRRARRNYRFGAVHEFCHEHSLTIFLVLTGLGWAVLFSRMDPESKWGTVISNIVSEWTQLFGLIILTKKLIEDRSNESR